MSETLAAVDAVCGLTWRPPGAVAVIESKPSVRGLRKRPAREDSRRLSEFASNETELVAGVETRVVEVRETKDGELVKVSRIFLAISRTTRDVYCFGKDVDTYKKGKVTSHEGAWQAGVNAAKCSLLMPGRPMVGERYYRAIAPGIAMDRSEIISLIEEVKTPVGTYEKCLRIRETSGLKSGSEDKLYAPDVGLLKDEKMVLLIRQIDSAVRPGLVLCCA